MKRKRFSEEQIIAVLKENEVGAKVDDLCRRHGISTATFYNEPMSRQRSERRWRMRKKYGGMDGVAP